jgi:hypothetical protein
MSAIGHRQLRWAQQDLTVLEKEWKAHRVHCVGCARSAVHRSAAMRCESGAAIAERLAALRAEVKRERELAKQPVPGQGELF